MGPASSIVRIRRYGFGSLSGRPLGENGQADAHSPRPEAQVQTRLAARPSGATGIRHTDRPTMRTLLGRVVAIVFGLLLPLIVLELSLRLFGPWIPGGYDTGPYIVRDERLGHRH